MGTVFVELRNADGTPIPGYTLADCEEIGGNFMWLRKAGSKLLRAELGRDRALPVGRQGAGERANEQSLVAALTDHAEIARGVGLLGERVAVGDHRFEVRATLPQSPRAP